jgi:hypothetical protein
MARKLEKSQWTPYFDRVSALSTGMRAEIEVASLRLGDQIEASWLPLIGIVYDKGSDALEVILEGVDHMIHKPREIYVEDGPGGLSSVLVIDGDGAQQIVKLREPLMLPAPAAAQ